MDRKEACLRRHDSNAMKVSIGRMNGGGDFCQLHNLLLHEVSCVFQRVCPPELGNVRCPSTVQLPESFSQEGF